MFFYQVQIITFHKGTKFTYKYIKAAIRRMKQQTLTNYVITQDGDLEYTVSIVELGIKITIQLDLV